MYTSVRATRVLREKSGSEWRVCLEGWTKSPVFTATCPATAFPKILSRLLPRHVLRIRNWRPLLHMRRADASYALIRWQYFSAWNDLMATILKVWREIKNLSRQSMSIYLKNNPAKCHLSPRQTQLGDFHRQTQKPFGPVADPEGPKGHGLQTHDRLKKSCESCCRRDSVFWRWRRLNLSRFHYTREDNVQCRLLQPVGTPAPLIEPQSAWNVRVDRRTGGLDLDVLQAEAHTQMGQRMH